MPEIALCTTCQCNIAPADCSTLIGRRFGCSVAETFKFCSTKCWTRWVAALNSRQWSAMVLPRLSDDFDIHVLVKALRAPARAKLAKLKRVA